MLQFKAQMISEKCPVYYIGNRMNTSDLKVPEDQMGSFSKHASPPPSY